MLAVRLWGVRGSVPTPRADCLGYGGNTTCFQLEVPDLDGVLIVDAGTGITDPALGVAVGTPIHLLLSHFHWDHIQGLPFFAPLYSASTELHVYTAAPSAETEDVLRRQMSAPCFPIAWDAVASRRTYKQWPAGAFTIGPAEVRTFPLRHPQGSVGFRIEAGGRTIAIVCDHEQGDAGIDARILDEVRGADVLIFDAQYTPEEGAARRGWGHSTWLDAVRTAEKAGAKCLVLTHHDPQHNDAFLDRMVADARREFANVHAAREGDRFPAQFAAAPVRP